MKKATPKKKEKPTNGCAVCGGKGKVPEAFYNFGVALSNFGKMVPCRKCNKDERGTNGNQ